MQVFISLCLFLKPIVEFAETVLEDIDSENSIDPERLHINQEGNYTFIMNYVLQRFSYMK